MKKYNRVLTIAGSDSGGCAGIQADIKTIQSLGCYASSAITAITAQNTLGVRKVYTVDDTLLAEQIDAVLSDIGADAVKIGMLSSPDIVETVAKMLKKYSVRNVVLDPVLVATSGDSLSSGGVADAIAEYLFPLATVVTPNRFEAEILSSENENERIWSSLSSKGAAAVLLKGGHTPQDSMMTDILFTTDNRWDFSHSVVDTANTHGTGCSLSSAIAGFLARGECLSNAVRDAVNWEVNAIKSGAEFSLGNGHGPLDHFWEYRRF